MDAGVAGPIGASVGVVVTDDDADIPDLESERVLRIEIRRNEPRPVGIGLLRRRLPCTVGCIGTLRGGLLRRGEGRAQRARPE